MKNNLHITETKSLALLTFYFGKLPWYFSYFIHSCKYNPSVSFFIVTDDNGYLEKLVTEYHKTDQQKAWCEMAEVTATPTILLNGYRLPDLYQLPDLEYMLE